MVKLNRLAVDRAKRTVYEHLEPGERIVEFDIDRGTFPPRVCLATNVAIYLVPPVGSFTRIPYSLVLCVSGEDEWLEIETMRWTPIRLEFGRRPRRLSPVISEQYKEVALKRRRFTCDWRTGGAIFLIVPSVTGPMIQSWQTFLRIPPADFSPALALSEDMMKEQAHGELQVALGLEPLGGLQYNNPRSSWMGEFKWDPPLSDASELAALKEAP